MAHFILDREHGKALEPVGKVTTEHSMFSSFYTVENRWDAYDGPTTLFTGTQADCDRFVAWVLTWLRKGEQVIDPKAFHTNTRRQ